MTDIVRRQLPSLDARLGRHVEHDPRSWGYQAPKAGVAADSRIHEHFGRVLNQGELGSCTGNAGAQSLMVEPLRQRHRTVSEKKVAIPLYSRATVIDGFDGEYPPDDSGSSGLAVCKAMVEAGYISRYEWAFGIDHARAALSYGPLMVGTAWYEAMFEPDGQGYVSIGGQIAGGHEYVCLGYVGEMYLFLNSWGREWGVAGPSDTGGCFWMSHATFGALLEDQGDVVQPIA